MDLLLKKGDIVVLKETSQYASSSSRDIHSSNPLGVSGCIYEANNITKKYRVAWFNGVANSGYIDADLQLLNTLDEGTDCPKTAEILELKNEIDLLKAEIALLSEKLNNKFV